MTDIIHRPSAPISPLTPPPDADKDTRYRMGKYLRWVGENWLMPDLSLYRDFLISEKLSPLTISGHLSMIRNSYRDLIRDRKLFFSIVKAADPDADRTERILIVNEMIINIHNAIDPKAVKISTKKIQDTPDAHIHRLTALEANELLGLPGQDTLLGKRDTAMIAILLCTGIRVGELVALEAGDLYHTFDDGEPGLLVNRGKGNKQRGIPYGDLIWCRTLTERWMTAADISNGPIFRAFWKGCKKVRPHALTTSGVEIILRRYSLLIAGELDYPRPHNLRRTYAKLMDDAGKKLMAIQQNLGHSSSKVTEGYIGYQDMKERRPPAIFSDVSGK
ncbi:MAG: tyrosine-type recombinase/integrase [Planctomycetota bacterium]|jgi:integrase